MVKESHLVRTYNNKVNYINNSTVDLYFCTFRLLEISTISVDLCEMLAFFKVWKRSRSSAKNLSLSQAGKLTSTSKLLPSLQYSLLLLFMPLPPLVTWIITHKIKPIIPINENSKKMILISQAAWVVYHSCFLLHVLQAMFVLLLLGYIFLPVYLSAGVSFWFLSWIP